MAQHHGYQRDLVKLLEQVWKIITNNSKYSDNNGLNFKPGPKEKSAGIYLLTTGALEKAEVDNKKYITNPMSIYGLAGNVWKKTLEHKIKRRF